jgi:hypothetical protein
MPHLELAASDLLSASDLADVRRSCPLTVFEAQGRNTLDLLYGADDLGFSAHSADGPNPQHDNGRDADRG